MSALARRHPAPSLEGTIDAYLAQIALSLRPASVRSATGILGRFATFVGAFDPAVVGAADLQRRHVEAYKGWLHTRPGRGEGLAPATLRAALSTVRMFFERLIEWGWEDAPARQLIFAGDIPTLDERLPKFLDDATFAAFLRAARAEPRPLARLVVELLARTGMRVGELCALEADAVVVIGAAHWLRIPVGKLHNDRYIPLHPQLVELLAEWEEANGANDHGLLIVNERGDPPTATSSPGS